MNQTQLTISLPRCRAQALRWVCEFIFENADNAITIEERDIAHIEIAAQDKVIRFQSIFPNFDTDRTDWHRQSPVEPLARFSGQDILDHALLHSNSFIPVLYGHPEIRTDTNTLDVETDFFGGIFFMLSRFEEVVCDDRDQHNRFPGRSSLAYREGFLTQPLADVYRHIIRHLIARKWPSWNMATEAPSPMQVSCDVDEPFDNSTTSIYRLTRSIGSDLIHRRSPTLAARRALNYALKGTIGPHFDPCYTFDWYMDVCDAQNLKATFYFIAGHSGGQIDGTYKIDEARILTLMRKIYDRGHNIGMHGSYNTFRDVSQLTRERIALIAALEQVGISLEINENRQHYLRWDTSCTPENLVSAGFKSDSSGGFADLPGFRYGTARMFNMWSWQKLQPLELVQKPLVVMEASLLSDLYLGLSNEEAADYAAKLQRSTEKFGGQFSVLWHNSSLKTPRERALFSEILARV